VAPEERSVGVAGKRKKTRLFEKKDMKEIMGDSVKGPGLMYSRIEGGSCMRRTKAGPKRWQRKRKVNAFILVWEHPGADDTVFGKESAPGECPWGFWRAALTNRKTDRFIRGGGGAGDHTGALPG